MIIPSGEQLVFINPNQTLELPTVTIYETQLGSQIQVTPNGAFVGNLTLIDRIKL